VEQPLDVSSIAQPHDPSSRRPVRAKSRLGRINKLFLATVAVPTVLAAIYYGLIASDIYISESRVVVRSPQRTAAGGLGSLLEGTAFSRAQDDTFSVHDFILSRDALQKLDQQLGVAKKFAASDVDIVNRFGGLDWDRSFEALHKYYQKRVQIDVDTSSSISAIRVSAFTAEDAHAMNELLLEMSEQLVNKLNERGRQDLIRFAQAEVEGAERKAKSAALAVSSYRNQKQVFDPDRQSAIQLQQISKLQDELIATKTQLVQVRTLAPQNPQVATLQQRAEILQSEIDAEMGKVAGNGASLTTKAPEYERLTLERGFAEKQLGVAMAGYEQARNEAQRKQLYLERIVQPSKPDVAVEPKRLRNVFATFVLGLIAWAILSVLIASVREHHD
jgi:capsular polysaccharide transport system permease protein